MKMGLDNDSPALRSWYIGGIESRWTVSSSSMTSHNLNVNAYAAFFEIFFLPI